MQAFVQHKYFHTFVFYNFLFSLHMDLQSILSSEISETAEEVLIATELLNSQIIYYHPSLPAPQLFF